ncbi:hypothetical protein GCM10010518_55200 [Kitasatospora cinereorecta]
MRGWSSSVESHLAKVVFPVAGGPKSAIFRRGAWSLQGTDTVKILLNAHSGTHVPPTPDMELGDGGQ